MSPILFKNGNENITSENILNSLRQVGAADCDALYIHTDMTFGLPAMGRKQLLTAILDIFLKLDVPTLVFPTFTFSFCNNEIYDPATSKTPMGAINEFARKTGLGFRTEDPLLSIYVIGARLNLDMPPGIESIGVDSSYDRLHNSGKNIKFLFFGADMSACFTYTHYMEAILNVPYRYPRKFNGFIRKAGESTPAEALLHTTYGNCVLNPEPVTRNTMQARGQLREVPIGGSLICCFSEKDAHETLGEMITANPFCFTDGTFDEDKKNTDYNIAGIHVKSVM